MKLASLVASELAGLRRMGKRILFLALLALGSAALAQDVAPGSYVYEGGGGSLIIRADKTFLINTVGANAHVCELDGRLVGSSSKMPGTQCVLTFKPQGSNVQLVTNGDEHCRYYCGMRASYEGLYIRPTPVCAAKAVATTRQAFQAQYKQKNYAAAVQTLGPLLRDCSPVLDRFDQDWIRNDLALAQLRSGDKAACLKTLAPLVELASMSDEDIANLPEPTFTDIYLRIAKATRTNLRLCKAAP